MTDTQTNKVAEALHELEEDSRFKALAETDDDRHFNRFREDVRNLRTRIFGTTLAREQIQQELRLLQAACFGATLAPFRPYLTRALVALDK